MPTPPRPNRDQDATPEPMTPQPMTPQPMTAEQMARRRPLIAFTAVAILAPLLLLGIATAVQISLLGSLPSEVAVHWDIGGQPDRYLPAWSLPLMTALLGVSMVVLLTASARPSLAAGDAGASYRVLGGLSLGLSTLIAVIFTATAWYQTDGGTVPIVGLAMTSAALALAAGVVAALSLPIPPHAERTVPATPLALDPDEQAAWLRTTTASRGTVGLAAAAFVMGLLATIFSWADGQSDSYVIGSAVVTILVAVAVATTVAYRVRVSADGLRAASVAGLPRFHVPLDDIAEVAVNPDVRPIGDYGGYGIRWRGKTTAVVPRGGSAIVVRRSSGRSFAVVVDDADAGAALLSALADRHRQADDAGPR